MSPDLATFLFEVVNFLLLAGALGWVLFRPVRRALDEEQQRQAEARGTIDERAAAVAERERAAEAAHADAEAELASRREGALARARAEAEDVLAAAREEAAERRRRLDAELEVRRHEAVADVTGEVAGLASALVRRLLERLDGPSVDRALVRAACEALGRLDGELGDVSVESARPLDEVARGMLRDTLGSDVPARVVPELGAGLRVLTAAGQVDVSARGLALEAARVTREGVRAG